MIPATTLGIRLRTGLLTVGIVAIHGPAMHAQQPTMALVGGRILDGFGGPTIETHPNVHFV